MSMKRVSTAVACLLAVMIAGCTAMPVDYAATLSSQDPKWQSPQCERVRLAASSYEETPVPWAAGLLLGPYGLGIVAAAKEHQEKQRRQLARELHRQCSSSPLPKELDG